LDLLWSLPANFRYNFVTQAGSVKGYQHTEEAKQLLSELRKGDKNPMFGKTLNGKYLIRRSPLL